MKKGMWWLILVPLCVVAFLARRVLVPSDTKAARERAPVRSPAGESSSVISPAGERSSDTSPAGEGDVTFRQFQLEQVKKYREFASSLRNQAVAPQEAQKQIKEYAKTKLIKAFLDYKNTEEGAKAAEEIDTELIVIGIQVAEDDDVIDRVVRSQKDPKKSLELKLFAAEQYARMRNSRKARELVDAVLRESKGKSPEIYKQAETTLFRVAPEGLVFPEFPEGTKDMDGKVIKVADYKGKIVLLDFWETWCGPCLGEVPNMVKAYEKYRDKGFEIVGISFDQSKEKFLEFIKKEKMTWRQYFDGLGWGNKVGKAYGIRAIPAMYLLGKDGRVITNNARGGRLEEVLRKELGGE